MSPSGMVEILRLEAKLNLRKGRLIHCISFSRIEAKPTMSIWTTSIGVVNSSREELYTLDPDFHREPWIPAPAPDLIRGPQE